MTEQRIAGEIVSADNEKRMTALNADYDALGAKLARDGIDIDAITGKVAQFFVAVPSWGVGTGGTRFARFPGIGEPRNIFDKIDDCAVIHQLTCATRLMAMRWVSASMP
jgi:L-rhamnose isomerase / sugar isomerase